jgi:hypothetical protein
MQAPESSRSNATHEPRPPKPFRIDVAILIVTSVATAVAVQAASLSMWWHAVVLSAFVIAALAVVGPTMIRTIQMKLHSFRRRREFAASWRAFQSEVEELRWIFDDRDASGLVHMLTELRHTRQEQGRPWRVEALRADAATYAAVGGIFNAVAASTVDPWPGAITAQNLVQAIETLVDLPNASNRTRLLLALDAHREDVKAARTWLSKYRAALDQYTRFARRQNRTLGERLYREYFSVPSE